MTIIVMNTDHTRTIHDGNAVACPRCRRQPIFASRVMRSGPCVDVFCGCEDRGGLVDGGVTRYAPTIDAAIGLALAAWNEHDHVMFRTFHSDGTVARAFRLSEKR